MSGTPLRTSHTFPSLPRCQIRDKRIPLPLESCHRHALEIPVPCVWAGPRCPQQEAEADIWSHPLEELKIIFLMKLLISFSFTIFGKTSYAFFRMLDLIKRPLKSLHETKKNLNASVRTECNEQKIPQKKFERRT